jgi:hypothetical protein
MMLVIFLCACTVAHMQPIRKACLIVFSLYSLLVELAWKEAAATGKLEEAGEGIRSAVHPRYLGHVADEPVEPDVPATMRD